MHKAYGGCPVGQVDASMTNVIQLEEGEYKLTRELQPNSSLSILGKLPANYRKADVLTNTFPAVTALKTTISGQGKSRIFNTTNLKKPALNLTNIILKDGYSSDTGGALYLGSTSVLTNVQILNSKAKSGGAIFLNDIESATKDLNKAIELDKNFETIYLYTSMIKHAQEKYQEALEESEKGIALIKTPNLIFQRAICKYELKNFEI